MVNVLNATELFIFNRLIRNFRLQEFHLNLKKKMEMEPSPVSDSHVVQPASGRGSPVAAVTARAASVIQSAVLQGIQSPARMVQTT